MGFLSRLLGQKADPEQAPFEISTRIAHEERIAIVGESHYQDAIRAACGGKPGEDVGFDCIAELVPEPTNKHDSNAIMVQIDGRCVGYLSRSDARTYGPAIIDGIQQQGTGICRAYIAGRANGETTNLGVWLHLDVTS
ncbi:MAG TPA: HIRAN domain-containing protein [Solirubrobacterales bacterium]|nr:HIRAN domain-containing protein [Solirubrobacterales bacterium]